ALRIADVGSALAGVRPDEAVAGLPPLRRLRLLGRSRAGPCRRRRGCRLPDRRERACSRRLLALFPWFLYVCRRLRFSRRKLRCCGGRVLRHSEAVHLDVAAEQSIGASSASTLVGLGDVALGEQLVASPLRR